MAAHYFISHIHWYYLLAGPGPSVACSYVLPPSCVILFFILLWAYIYICLCFPHYTDLLYARNNTFGLSKNTVLPCTKL